MFVVRHLLSQNQKAHSRGLGEGIGAPVSESHVGRETLTYRNPQRLDSSLRLDLVTGKQRLQVLVIRKITITIIIINHQSS